MESTKDEDECMMVLRDPKGCIQFRRYLKMVIASEILDFWIEIELFRQKEWMGNEEMIKSLQIYNKYCYSSSLHAINIPDKMRRTIRENISNQHCHLHMFDETQQYIYNLLALDCFLKFRESEQYRCYKGVKSENTYIKDNSVHSVAFLDHVRSKKEKRATASQENLILYVSGLKKMAKKERKNSINRKNNSHIVNTNNLAMRIWCGMTKSTVVQ